ncbi:MULTISPECIES: hypothetical protein [Enterobacter]|uniref:hypothetical protein n=1 Tax=Enterobacter TaxID=547 RepID=UPI0005DB953B|nr:hypothetical protein [Enterobacter kobei]ELE9732536.1 hypothetical protein [Enterobacter kobei]KJI51425.1 hypothetical protein UO85_15885 [Enterobacter kobei]MBD3599489.1 hypothetical protein [Enterobacter kobei]MBG0589463.1 hypothetical protein [Enterobacter kobei]MCK6796139.1 hypothetical protein [Enterobacter kobei]
MKHFIIAATLLASLGANASAFVCKDMNGKKATIENGVAKQGEFMGYAGKHYYHSGTAEDGSSIFTFDEQNRLYVHWVNDGLTIVTVFSPVMPKINEFECRELSRQ